MPLTPSHFLGLPTVTVGETVFAFSPIITEGRPRSRVRRRLVPSMSRRGMQRLYILRIGRGATCRAHTCFWTNPRLGLREGRRRCQCSILDPFPPATRAPFPFSRGRGSDGVEPNNTHRIRRAAAHRNAPLQFSGVSARPQGPRTLSTGMPSEETKSRTQGSALHGKEGAGTQS